MGPRTESDTTITKTDNKLKEFTYIDVRTLNKTGRSVCAIHGKVYDITDFIAKHPGGAIIRTALGRDATILFEIHHNLVDIEKVSVILEKYCIGKVKDYVPVANFDTEFARTLKARCREAVKDMSHRDSVYSTSAVLLYFIVFVGLLYLAFTTGSLLLTPVLGIVMAIGHLIGHAGNHWSLSSNEWANRFISMTCTNLWGLYEKNWEFSHVISHHCYNYTDRDYIMEQHVPFSYFRTRHSDPWKPIHAYQHLFYRFSNITSFFIGGLRLDCAPWVFLSPLLRSLRRNTDSVVPAPQFFAAGPNISSQDDLGAEDDGVGPRKFFIFYEDYDHLVSILMANVIWLPLFINLWSRFGLLHAVLFNSCTFGFQAAKVTTSLLTQHACEDIVLQKEYRASDDWYRMQVEASTSVQATSIMMWLTCCVSFQTEHHMFPAANPKVIMALQPIVRQVSKEFNVKYHYFPSTKDAIKSVYAHFVELGKKPEIKQE